MIVPKQGKCIIYVDRFRASIIALLIMAQFSINRWNLEKVFLTMIGQSFKSSLKYKILARLNRQLVCLGYSDVLDKTERIVSPGRIDRNTPTNAWR